MEYTRFFFESLTNLLLITHSKFATARTKFNKIDKSMQVYLMEN